MVGPGAILLALSIGGGEWLVAPAAAARYGTDIMWIATVAILLQLVFNLEAIRYTLYTGEPIYGGILRLRPGSKVWAIFYCILTILSLGWPATAGASAAIVFTSFTGQLPGTADAGIHYWITVGVVLAVVLILSIGGTVERSLERFSWLMIAFIFTFLLAVNAFFVPWTTWGNTARGFFTFSRLRAGDLDWSLMGALAATAGAGGMANLTITNWMRDKGYGMGQLVGAIPSAFGGIELKLSHIGSIFLINEENLRRWKEWIRYVHLDQILVWGFLAFVGMFLNVNLATAVIPPGSDLSGLAAGAYQAQYLAEYLWAGFWFLALLNGFWILFSTQLGDTDVFVRTITDIIWISSDKLRTWHNGNVRKVYYGLLFFFTAWGFIAITLAAPFVLFAIMGNVAGFVLMFSSIQILAVNRRFLPKELQPPLWREIALVCCCLFYGFFVVNWLLELLGNVF